MNFIFINYFEKCENDVYILNEMLFIEFIGNLVLDGRLSWMF